MESPFSQVTQFLIYLVCAFNIMLILMVLLLCENVIAIFANRASCRTCSFHIGTMLRSARLSLASVERCIGFKIMECDLKITVQLCKEFVKYSKSASQLKQCSE